MAAILKVRDTDGNIVEIAAIKGRDGIDGTTPTKGVDYYTDADKTEMIEAVMAAAADRITPEYIGASEAGHNHDDRYYTETESDIFLDKKLDKVQTLDKAGLYLRVGSDGTINFVKAPTAVFSNGPFLITESQTIDFASEYGLQVGDKLNVICIGGGGGGGAGGHDSGVNGGSAGCSGENEPAASRPNGGGGGGGYGGGGGGAAGAYNENNDEYYSGGGGGGSGYIAAKTITLTDTKVNITIGKGGSGGTIDVDYNRNGYGNGESGGTTSFGSYLSAAGGEGGGEGEKLSRGAAGIGGHNGGYGSKYNSDSKIGGGGGGGGGGWIVTGFTLYSGTPGEDSSEESLDGGAGGTDGGTSGVDAGNGFGHGCVLFWY